MECEIASFYTHEEPVARKEHRCCECRSPINKGERHFRCTGKWGGKIQTFRQHLLCMEACMFVRDHLSDECIPFGELEEFIGEFRRDIRESPRGSDCHKLRQMMARIHRRERKHRNGR